MQPSLYDIPRFGLTPVSTSSADYLEPVPGNHDYEYADLKHEYAFPSSGVYEGPPSPYSGAYLMPQSAPGSHYSEAGQSMGAEYAIASNHSTADPEYALATSMAPTYALASDRSITDDGPQYALASNRLGAEYASSSPTYALASSAQAKHNPLFSEDQEI